MPKNRKLLGAAAFSLALAGGGAAGAILGTPTLTLAQDAEDETPRPLPSRPGRRPPRASRRRPARGRRGGDRHHRGRAARGPRRWPVDRQVAEANGVDVQTVIDAMVAAATERLEAAIEALPERMAEVVEREGLPDRGPGHGGGHFGAGLDAAAEAIGITSEELRTALRDGSTIAEVAEANSVEVQTVIDALVADAGAAIDQAVANGRLTEERAAEIKANLPERFEAMVNGEGRFGGPPPAEVTEPDTEGSNTAA